MKTIADVQTIGLALALAHWNGRPPVGCFLTAISHDTWCASQRPGATYTTECTCRPDYELQEIGEHGRVVRTWPLYAQ